MRPRETAFLVQSMARERGMSGMVGRWSYYDAALRQIDSSVRPEYRYDPRTRPWYAEAAEKNTQILTAPYVFFTTQEVGVTLSQPSEDGRAVIGLDVALTDLGREIAGLRLMPRTEIAVVDKDLRVLAYPDMSRVIMQGGATSSLRLRTLDDLGVSSLQAMQGPGLQSGKSQRLVADGEEWLTRALPLESMRWRGLQILMAIPTQALLADVNENLRRQVWLSVSLIGLMLPVGWLAGRAAGGAQPVWPGVAGAGAGAVRLPACGPLPVARARGARPGAGDGPHVGHHPGVSAHHPPHQRRIAH